MYLGDYAVSKTIYHKFTTRDSNVPATLSGTPAISVYKDNSTTESTTGVTLTVDFDSRTGQNHVAIDLSADGTFYASGHDFAIVITTGTVGGTSVVGEVVGTFSIENRSALRPATAGNTISVDGSGRVDVAKIAGTSQTARDIGASVLLSSGTGTGQVVLSAGAISNVSTVGTCTTVTTTTNLTNLPAAPTDWLSAAAVSSAGAVKIAGKVLDEVNTGATHNVTNSLGKQVRSLTGGTTGGLFAGTATTGSTSTTIKLDGTASAVDNAYQWQIVDDLTTDESRIITSYVGSTKVATVDRAWVVTPSNGDSVEVNETASVRVVAYATGQDPATLVWAAGTRTITGGTVTTATNLTNLPTIPVDWLTAAGLASDAVAEIQSGLSTFDATGDRVILGEGAHGGIVGSSTSTFALKRFAIANDTSDPAFDVSNSGGDSTRFRATGSSGNGFVNLGAGTSAGQLVQGGSDGGPGLAAQGGGSAGSAFSLTSAGPALYVVSTGDSGFYLQGLSVALGIYCDDTGPAIEIGGGNTNGAGISIYTTDGHGIEITASGSGKHGILSTGGVGGHGIYGEGGTNGDGFHGEGGGTGVGFKSMPDATGFGASVASIVAGVIAEVLPEDYAAAGAEGTLPQILYLIQQRINEFLITGTTLAVAGLDGKTNVANFTLNDSKSPTGSTRAS